MLPGKDDSCSFMRWTQGSENWDVHGNSFFCFFSSSTMILMRMLWNLVLFLCMVINLSYACAFNYLNRTALDIFQLMFFWLNEICIIKAVIYTICCSPCCFFLLPSRMLLLLDSMMGMLFSLYTFRKFHWQLFMLIILDLG